jgi:heme/copper-type cytochrome/quinol oxidase subunit 2
VRDESTTRVSRTSHASLMSQPLAEIIFWIAAVACVIAEVAILRFTFATQSANKSELVPASSRSGEIAWAIIPALALIVVFGATWQRIQARQDHMEMMHHPGMQHSTQTSAPVRAPNHPTS